MDNKKSNYQYESVFQLKDENSSRRFMANVFMWMFVALSISAFCAYMFTAQTTFRDLLINSVANTLTVFGVVSMILPLAFVMIINFGMNRISFPILAILFVAYAAATGVSFSVILTAFTPTSVLGVFLTSMILFGVMAIAGYVTQTDLTKFGAIMTMLLIGLVIASLVNFFMRSQALYYVTSYVGVAVFVGLTAFDVQKLKRISMGVEYGDASIKKTALMGALTLYLDFVNLFLFLLRIFGSRR